MQNECSNAIEITLLYFASLAEMAKQDEEVLAVASHATLAEVYTDLAQKYGFDLEKSRLGVAINHEFCTWDTPLNNGDIVAFIPPVAGG